MKTLHLLYTRSTLLMLVAAACSITVLLGGCSNEDNGPDQVEVTGLQPVRGEAGDTVHVYGVGFGETTAQNTVYFNGQQAVVDTVNEAGTELTVRVPSAATTGPVSVSVGGAPSRGGLYFTVIQPDPEPEPGPSQIYWSGQTRSGDYVIKTTYMEDGAPVTETVYTMEDGFTAATGVAIDLAGGHLYLADPDGGYVGRASLDGSSPAIDTLYSGDAEGATQPQYLALDLENEQVYWSDSDRIMRGPLAPGGDAAGDTVYTALTTPTATNAPAGLWLDVEGNNLYWTENGDEVRVQQGTLDGAALATTLYNEGDVRGGLTELLAVVTDPENNWLYLSDRNSATDSRILRGRSNGDGLLQTVLIGGREARVALSPLAVDSVEGYLYWTQSLAIEEPSIMRAKLVTDGYTAGPEEVVYNTAALGGDVEVIYSIALAPAEAAGKAKGAAPAAIQLHF